MDASQPMVCLFLVQYSLTCVRQPPASSPFTLRLFVQASRSQPMQASAVTKPKARKRLRAESATFVAGAGPAGVGDVASVRASKCGGVPEGWVEAGPPSVAAMSVPLLGALGEGVVLIVGRSPLSSAHDSSVAAGTHTRASDVMVPGLWAAGTLICAVVSARSSQDAYLPAELGPFVLHQRFAVPGFAHLTKPRSADAAGAPHEELAPAAVSSDDAMHAEAAAVASTLRGVRVVENAAKVATATAIELKRLAKSHGVASAPPPAKRRPLSEAAAAAATSAAEPAEASEAPSAVLAVMTIRNGWDLDGAAAVPATLLPRTGDVPAVYLHCAHGLHRSGVVAMALLATAQMKTSPDVTCVQAASAAMSAFKEARGAVPEAHKQSAMTRRIAAVGAVLAERASDALAATRLVASLLD